MLDAIGPEQHTGRRASLTALVIAAFLGGLDALGGPDAYAQALSTAPAQISLGTPLSLERGPWVLGEILFFSGARLAIDYAWRDKVRGSRGALYTKADIASDVEQLMSLGRFEKVEPTLYEIPGAPIPQDFMAIAASTSQVRLVFQITEKAAPVPQAQAGKPKKPIPPAAVSGVVFTPTAWRGAGKYTTPGMGLDISGMYVIGRLYGENSFENTPRKTNYIDRVGVWLLTADGKMQVQSEGAWRPAVAVGGQGSFLLRDSPQPKVGQIDPSISVNPQQKSTKLLTDGYVVMSKKFGPLRSSAGFMQGNIGDSVAYFSEFLTPDALSFFAGQRGQTVRSRSIPFASLLFLPKPQYPLAVEFMKFNGAALNPVMINFKIGYFLKFNFDIAILKFNGGYDVLGILQFRYNHFPRR